MFCVLKGPVHDAASMADQVLDVGVVGASGYTGDELLRVILKHPGMRLQVITSRQSAGQTLGKVLGGMWRGLDLKFEDLAPTDLITRAEVFFLALPHGVAAEFALPLLEAGKTVFDLSADFRLKDATAYREFYGADHPAPEWLSRAVYGNPELHRSELREASLVACPGCYPTSALCATAPALQKDLVDGDRINLVAMSGVSGAGRKASIELLFCECNEDMRPYGIPRHRHIPEIEQEMSRLAGRNIRVTFVPNLVPVTRGMLTIATFPLKNGDISQKDVQMIYEAFFESSPFVQVLENDQLPATSRVSRSNVCEVAVRKDERTNTLIAIAAQDNLGKGAAWQAVQAFNVRFGYPETMGLEG